MTNKETVIAGSNNVTAEQLREFFQQIDERVITGSILKRILKNKEYEDILFSKREVLSFIHSFYTDKENSFPKRFPVDKLEDCRRIIFYVIENMRRSCENLSEQHSNVKKYYSECWKKFDDAKDDKDLIEAIDFLAISLEKD